MRQRVSYPDAVAVRATVMAIMQNREWEIVTLPRLRAILLRPLILREARTLNRYSRRGDEDYSLYSIFPGVCLCNGFLSAPQQKSLSPYWARGSSLWVVISKRRDRAMMRGNYSQEYNEGRSTLCIIVVLRHEEKVYPVPSNAGRYKGRSDEGRVLEGPALKKRRNRNWARQNRCGQTVAGCSGVYRRSEWEGERDSARRWSRFAHGGFNACKTRGVRRAGKRGTTPEVTKPLNYRLVPLLRSRVGLTATASGRGLDRPRQYSKEYERSRCT